MDLTLGNTEILIQRAKNVGMLRNQLAYVLATAYWETAKTMKPVKEAFWKSETWRKNNLRYYPWYGRGYVQLTWESNYRKAGDELRIDLLTDADVALEPTIAADICIAGMREGWFTGKKLSDYITLKKSDFINARKIINGKDRAAEIAEIAKTYDKLLKEAGYGEANSPFKVPSSPVQTNPSKPSVSTPVTTKPSEKPPIATTGAVLTIIESILLFITKLFGGSKGA